MILLLKSINRVLSPIVLETEADFTAIIIEIYPVGDKDIQGMLGEILIKARTAIEKASTMVRLFCWNTMPRLQARYLADLFLAIDWAGHHRASCETHSNK